MRKTPRLSAPPAEARPPRQSATHRWRLTSRLFRWLAPSLLVAATTACNRHIEEDPPIPEHRIAPCETWCSMMFDPVCPAADVEVPTEEECVEGCATNEILWGTVDDEDECAPTYLPYVECLASLPCDELRQHFERVPNFEDLPPAEWSSCGELASAQLECQFEHY